VTSWRYCTLVGSFRDRTTATIYSIAQPSNVCSRTLCLVRPTVLTAGAGWERRGKGREGMAKRAGKVMPNPSCVICSCTHSVVSQSSVLAFYFLFTLFDCRALALCSHSFHSDAADRVCLSVCSLQFVRPNWTDGRNACLQFFSFCARRRSKDNRATVVVKSSWICHEATRRHEARSLYYLWPLVALINPCGQIVIYVWHNHHL